jgi:hypothetical protein
MIVSALRFFMWFYKIDESRGLKFKESADTFNQPTFYQIMRNSIKKKIFFVQVAMDVVTGSLSLHSDGSPWTYLVLRFYAIIGPN